ncbi:hypothetical protein XENTR_v10002935 [Xenopus tropicalis]|nr:hypothetical protein XENTR_v10002935 [Xenopus tropicalis]
MYQFQSCRDHSTHNGVQEVQLQESYCNTNCWPPGKYCFLFFCRSVKLTQYHIIIHLLEFIYFLETVIIYI